MRSWKQLTIYIGESDCWHHQPLYQALLGVAHQHQLTGATVIRAIAGYGRHGIFRTDNELDNSLESSALPLLVIVIDREAAISEFLSSVKEMVEDKFVTCQSIEVFESER